MFTQVPSCNLLFPYISSQNFDHHLRANVVPDTRYFIRAPCKRSTASNLQTKYRKTWTRRANIAATFGVVSRSRGLPRGLPLSPRSISLESRPPSPWPLRLEAGVSRKRRSGGKTVAGKGERSINLRHRVALLLPSPSSALAPVERRFATMTTTRIFPFSRASPRKIARNFLSKILLIEEIYYIYLRKCIESVDREIELFVQNYLNFNGEIRIIEFSSNL